MVLSFCLSPCFESADPHDSTVLDLPASFTSHHMATPLDGIIRRLFAASSERRGTWIKLKEEDLTWLCNQATRVLKNDPILLELEAPLAICGDLHGQFYDLLEFFKLGGQPPETTYLFLGDYVDRGTNSIETFSLLLALKIKYPNKVFLLRGNHESPEICRLYGFFAECCERYNQRMWDTFVSVFQWLPLAAVVSGRIFCVHGGLSPLLTDVKQISQIKRPLNIEDDEMVTGMLWADPSNEHIGYDESERGTGHTFGEDVANAFLERHDYDLLCRAHQVVPRGFEFPFHPNTTVVTVFSAPDYCGEMGNTAAMLLVDEKLNCSFQFVAPVKAEKKISFRQGTPSYGSRQ